MKKNNLLAKFYVTTSIPYVNAKPHIGHLLEFIQADTLARFHRGIGDETFLLTGTDEHGQKIFEAAQEAGEDTKIFAAKNSEKFLAMAKSIGMTNNYFVRTTDDRHKLAAQKMWQACSKDIYKGTYSGLYCTGCEQYYTAREADDDKCPIHHTVLEVLEMESYFFALSKYQKAIIELIQSNTLNIFPLKRRNEMLQFAKNLEDVSISRPKTALLWGVEVPGDSTHVMYVWFDALTNYISAIGYNDDPDMLAKFWPVDIHVVGKDIARQHCLLWPAMLLSAGLETPKGVYVHPFIDSGGQKMSKSLGNVIDPIEYIQEFGSEAMRYFLLRYIPYDNDGDFTRERFVNAYNADLANNLGNLVARTATMIVKYCDGKYRKVDTKPIIGLEEDMADCAFNKYLDKIFDQLDSLNASIEANKPWELVKTNPQKTTEFLSSLACEIVAIAIALKPFLPDTADKIIKTFADGKVNSDIGILFPRIEV